MYKSSILLSAFGLALSAITLTAPAVTQHSIDPHGWGMGIEQDFASNIFDLQKYSITANYKKGPWLFKLINRIISMQNWGTEIVTAAEIWRLHPLSAHWTLQYGINGAYTYLSNPQKMKAGAIQSPWDLAAQAGIAYTYNSHIRLSLTSALVQVYNQVTGVKKISFIKAPSLNATYFFN